MIRAVVEAENAHQEEREGDKLKAQILEQHL
jgi:hypothetical protein